MFSSDGHFDTRDLIPNISEVQDGKLENRQKKVNCELLQTDVTKANFRQGLSLNLFQLINKYSSFTKFCSKNAKLAGSEDCQAQGRNEMGVFRLIIIWPHCTR